MPSNIHKDVAGVKPDYWIPTLTIDNWLSVGCLTLSGKYSMHIQSEVQRICVNEPQMSEG